MLTVESLDDLVTTNDAATQIGVTCDTIRQWVKRGHLQVTGLTERGHNMYRLIDVLRAAQATRDRAIGRNRRA